MNKTLGNYQIMITSKYFESIDDFINLEVSVKRFNGNMERFHFNPIRINYYTRKFFSNIETLNLYNKDDKVFNDGKIFKQCIWYEVDYGEYLQEKEKGNDCKLICCTKEDRLKYENTIGEYCFSECDLLKKIIISRSVTKLFNFCFHDCSSL